MRTLLLLLASGCIMSVTYSQLNVPPHAMRARSIETVEVFASGPPQRAHVDVALIRAGSDDRVFALDEFVANVRQQAAHLGCDAVVLGNSEGRSTVTAMQATCIVYSDTPPGVAKQ